MLEILEELLMEAENDVKEASLYGANSYGLGYEVGRRDLLIFLIASCKEGKQKS